MSNAGTRTAIKTALDGIGGIRGFDKQPNGPRPGDAWPMWRGSVREDGNGQFFENWDVLVVVPADEVRASAFCDDHQDSLIDGLAPVMYVDSFTPTQVPAEGGAFNALMITGRVE